MPLRYHPDIADALSGQPGIAADVVPPERGDSLGLRPLINDSLADFFSKLPPSPDVRARDCSAPHGDGTPIQMWWYTRGDERPGSAVVYVHGGGMFSGSAELYDPLVRHYVQMSGVPFLAVDYRLAPEVTGTVPAEDVVRSINWLRSSSERLGVDATRIALMGDSGGGGIAASAAILARSAGIDLAHQILIYPMLDDRNTIPDRTLASTATWTYDSNYTGWQALLGDNIGRPSVTPFAAPARLDDFTGLASAYIEVGELDIFRDECVDYARRLMSAEVSCELHVVPGAPHAYDLIGMDHPIGRLAIANRVRVLESI
ncbi:alpha/beta hydrolase [Rhodococcus koreensis]